MGQNVHFTVYFDELIRSIYENQMILMKMADFDIFRVLRVVFAHMVHMIWIWFIWSWTFHWINTEDTLSLMKTKIFRLFSSQQLILWLKRHILCHFRLLFSATGPRIMNTYSKMASALILYYSLGVQIINFARFGIFFKWKWPILVKLWTKIHYYKLEMYQKLIFGWKCIFFKNQFAQSQNFEIYFESFDPGLLEIFK